MRDCAMQALLKLFSFSSLHMDIQLFQPQYANGYATVPEQLNCLRTFVENKLP